MLIEKESKAEELSEGEVAPGVEAAPQPEPEQQAMLSPNQHTQL